MSEYQYVNAPKINEAEMKSKLDDIRKSVGGKMKKWADAVQFSMYSVPQIERLEGERWVEDGKSWIMHDGVKKSVSFLQEARMPWWCPKCSVPMNHRFDRKFYFLRGHCFNCNVEWEGKMRLEGTWETFEKRMLRENEKSFLRDKIQEHIDYIENFKEPQAHFYDGRYEILATKEDFSMKFKELEDDIELMLNRLNEIQVEEELEEMRMEESHA